MPSPGIAIVMDYQNVLQRGHAEFGSGFEIDKVPLHPSLLAGQVAHARRLAIERRSYVPGTQWIRDSCDDPVKEIHVHRGVPNESRDKRGHRINWRQKHEWERDPAIRVSLRPMKYVKRRAYATADLQAFGQEKGVDVAIAMSLAELAVRGDHRVIILMSQDSDLTPALEFARRLNPSGVSIESTGWRHGMTHPGFWQTRLAAAAFWGGRDKFPYDDWWESRGQYRHWRNFDTEPERFRFFT